MRTKTRKPATGGLTEGALAAMTDRDLEAVAGGWEAGDLALCRGEVAALAWECTYRGRPLSGLMDDPAARPECGRPHGAGYRDGCRTCQTDVDARDRIG